MKITFLIEFVYFFPIKLQLKVGTGEVDFKGHLKGSRSVATSAEINSSILSNSLDMKRVGLQRERERGPGQLNVYYTSPQCFIITFSNSIVAHRVGFADNTCSMNGF